MALALVLTTISPEIGGVLVRGEKGTAKSTLVRALADLLPDIRVIAGDRFSTDPAEPQPLSPDGPFDADAAVETRPVRLVELPVGATEDRVAGSIHLERALSDGTVHFEPGLLARAHRGILYVDEVNLLHDHLVDLLLDAAAMGRLTVERDGISVTHQARFVIVGTMNPEEGELRPQLLDRFGLSVEVAAPQDPAQRAEVVRRRLAFDADPEGFRSRYLDAEVALRQRISEAQDRVTGVELTSAALLRIAEVCSAFGVDGMRADIVTARTAAAHAAWQGRTDITVEDLRVAARLALPHRRRRNPFDAPGLQENELDELLPPEAPEDDPEPDPDPEGGEAPRRRRAPPDADAGGSAPRPGGGQPAPVGAGEPFRARLFTVDGVGEGQAGKRSRARAAAGRRTGATPLAAAGAGLHLLETVRAAAPFQADEAAPAAGCCCAPKTCAARCGRAARPTWCSSSSTPPGRWPPGSGCGRSRLRSCRCCSTPTAAGIASPSSPSAVTTPRWPCPQRARSTSRPGASTTCPQVGEPPWRRACSKRSNWCAANGCGTPADGPCSW